MTRKVPPRPMTDDQKARAASADYDVGFGKAPAQHRFKPGESGRSRGRPKGSRSLKTDLLEVADMEIQVTTPRGAQMVSLQHAIVLNMGVQAAKGDVRAAQAFIRLLELTAPERIRQQGEVPKLDPQERAVLDALLGDLGLIARPQPDEVEP